jgi:hypothetical protein
MNSQLAEKVSLAMPKGTLLVLFEYLARSYDSWRVSTDAADEATFNLQKPDGGERLALWQFEGEIERSLPEVFAPDYKLLIAAWKEELVSNRR